MNRQYRILKKLKENAYITASLLSKSLNVSVRTIRNDIDDLNYKLKDQGAFIVSKARHGYCLEISDKDKYASFLDNLENDFNNDNISRIYQIAEYLLELDESITMDDLCDNFYISRTTLKADMQEIRKLFNKFNIEVDARANQGLKIIGSEQNIRHSLTYIQRKTINSFSKISKKEIENISKIIESCINKYHFEISDFSITNLSLHIYISVMRIKSGKIIKIASDIKEKLDSNTNKKLILDIVRSIEKEYHIKFPNDELYYLLIQVSGKRFFENTEENYLNNTVVTNDVYKLVGDMLSRVYDVFKIDFRYDLDLITALSMHLVPLEFRMKYDMTVENNMKDEIRQRVILPFNMASIACEFLEKKYKKRLPDDEVTFIALHFYVALERKKSGQKDNLLVVCGSGKASSELLVYQIKNYLNDVFNVVKTISRHSLKDYNFKNIDYILTTVEINISVPVPIIMTEDFLEMKEIKRIKNTVSTNHLDNVLSYFDENLIFWLDLDNKNDIIKYLCDKAISLKKAQANFYESVLKREEIGRTSFGNLISIPHPLKPIGDKSFVAMAILKKPILWDDQKVQVVVLLSMKEKGDNGLQDFYKVMSKLVSNRLFVNMLCKTKDYKEVISVLHEVICFEG